MDSHIAIELFDNLHGKVEESRKMRWTKSNKKALVVQEDTRGRPTLKKQQQRKQDVARNNSFTGSQQSKCDHARHNSYITSQESRQASSVIQYRRSMKGKGKQPQDDNAHLGFPLIMGKDAVKNINCFKDSISSLFYPYISHIQDVNPDGNCGFRSVALGLGFAFQEYDKLRHTIDWQDVKAAPVSRWMSMPYIGLLIAQRFRAIAHLLSIADNQTFFPLWFGPNVHAQHQIVSLVHVNRAHFIHVKLEGDFPILTPNALWNMHRNDDAAEWEKIYSGRIERFKKIMLGEVQLGPGTAVDWGLLEEVQEAEQARAIIGQDTPWSRLFDLSFTETYREVIVEFLSTFIYSEAGLELLPGEAPDMEPDHVSFSIFGTVYRQTLCQWAVTTGLYHEPETVTPLYTEAVTEVDKEELLVFWGLISDSPWLDTKGRVSEIRDSLYRYMHQLISTSIAPHLKSREWCTDRYLFFLYCLLTGRRCSLSTCMALYFSSAYMRQKRGLLYGGAFITQIIRPVTPFHAHDPAMLPAIPSVRLDRRTVSGMRITHRFP
ncbi:hypothetical protein L1987_30855 [Smallanthus sonchifolius]|uniref:Uncharacterized protein n=1 Tax=Smallanthus sonchifolius TaxID=185202 RepID=A0ACB9I3Y4_9ASTR|nr:hypothetical protein L1987_30855 [Smallanthus sonchifolius]